MPESRAGRIEDFARYARDSMIGTLPVLGGLVSGAGSAARAYLGGLSSPESYTGPTPGKAYQAAFDRVPGASASQAVLDRDAERLGAVPAFIADLVNPATPPGLGALATKAVSHAPDLAAILAFHGSPHLFDRFSAKHIGTGEGAQAFGHGLYLAENPSVAKGYQKSLGGPSGGHLYETNIDVDPEDLLDWDAPLSQQSEKVREALGRVKAGARDLDTLDREELQYLASEIDPNGIWTDDAFEAEFGYVQSTDDLRDSVKDLLEESPDYITGQAALDLMESSEHVTGQSLMRQLEATLGSHDRAVEVLREAGIPGLRYFDAMSRGADDGTRNIVMFPGTEDKINILSVNGEPRGALSEKP